MKIRKIIIWGVDEFFSQVTHFGNLFTYLTIIVAALVFGDYLLGAALFVSLALIMIIGLFVKALFWKERPKKQKYENYLEKIDASSFPSIHAARISSLAIIMHFFSDSLPVTAFFVFFAVLVAYSRIYLKKHYPVDVLGGIILGVATAFLAVVLVSF